MLTRPPFCRFSLLRPLAPVPLAIATLLMGQPAWGQDPSVPLDPALAPLSLGHGDPASTPALETPAPDPIISTAGDGGTSIPGPELTPLAQTVTAVTIQDIQVQGSTVFSEDTLEAIVAPFEGKTLSPEEIQSITDAVTQLYLNNGYFTSRAQVGNQTIDDSGILVIEITEGQADIVVEWLTEKHFLQESYIRDRLPSIHPLNTLKLEDELKLLRVDPLLDTIEARLKRGNGEQPDVLTVQVREAPNFHGSFNADNYSPPSIGGERFSLNLAARNLSGRGDQLSATYRTTVTGGLHSLDTFYAVPLNAKNGTLSLQGTWDFTKITQPPFDVLEITGDRQRYALNFRQPIWRTPKEEFSVSAAFVYTEGQTFVFGDIPTPFGLGADKNGISRTSVLRFSQEYIRRDRQGAWVARWTESFGTHLFDATDNPAPIPDGQFFSWLGQAQRLQSLNRNNLLIIQGDLQLTPHSLLSSEQFVIGGAQSIRGYRQNALVGDNGFRFSVENRTTLKRNSEGEGNLILMSFLEAGAVLNAKNNPSSISSNQTVLAGLGLGVIWKPIPNLDLRLDYGLPLIGWDQEGDNAQDHGIYFNAGYAF